MTERSETGVEKFLLYYLCFWIYSFFGWAVESVFCSVNEHKLINRGFLSGPICPIYGFGALIVVLCLTPFLAHPLFLFIDAVVLTSILEYFTSYLMEKLFHARWWDYSQHHFNLNGRICLATSLSFGGLSLFVMYLLHPGIVRLIGILSPTGQAVTAVLFSAVFLVDFSTTIRGMVSFQRKLERLAELSAQIKERLDAIHWKNELPIRERLEQYFQEKREEHAEITADAKESIRALADRLSVVNLRPGFIQRRLKRAFPHLTFHRNLEQARSLKEWLDRKRKHKDEK